MDRQAMDNISELLNPTEEQQIKMYRHIMANYKTGGAPIKRLRPIIAAAVAVCFLITTTAFAANYLELDKSFLNFLNPATPEQEQNLAQGAYEVNKQVTNQNGTLHVRQVMGDGYLTYILMDFIAPEGTVLNEARYYFEDYDFIADIQAHGTGIITLKDDNPQDNKISLIMNITADESLMGKEATLKLSNLQGADPYPAEFHTMVPGNWTVSFPLNFKENSSQYEVNQPLEIYGYQATLQKISVSPISVTIKAKSKHLKEINQAARPWTEVSPNVYLDQYPVTINYSDGTKETTEIFAGMCWLDYLEEELLTIKPFENAINDKEIKSITFFGTEIPLQ